MYTNGGGLSRARRQGDLRRRSRAKARSEERPSNVGLWLANLDRSARLRLQAIHRFAAQSRLLCRLLSTRAMASQKPHRTGVAARRGETKGSSAEGCGRMLRIRLDLKTTGRCGSRKSCAYRGDAPASRGGFA